MRVQCGDRMRDLTELRMGEYFLFTFKDGRTDQGSVTAVNRRTKSIVYDSGEGLVNVEMCDIQSLTPMAVIR